MKPLPYTARKPAQLRVRRIPPQPPRIVLVDPRTLGKLCGNSCNSRSERDTRMTHTYRVVRPGPATIHPETALEFPGRNYFPFAPVTVYKFCAPYSRPFLVVLRAGGAKHRAADFL